MDEFVTLDLSYLTETELAYKFLAGSQTVWLPKSQLKSVLKFPMNELGITRCQVVLPEWLAIDKSL
jgi:hypothetical protein